MKLDKRKVYNIIFFSLLILAFMYLLFNENGILKYIKDRREIRKLEQEINDAEMKLHILQLEIDSLKTSKEKIERVAREKYHMLKPTEKVLKVEEY
ncbi:MAG: septum formation initiator family protein [Melioribacter sp.]|jgi:cell division protein FtsB|uniref:FtsB family cell division protein n=1 Tax=Rosettibacter primus TaxID=3111523 RepID=UPI00247E7FDA|nr:septum formation initiator family protein [Melioribacter sp.]